MNDTQKRTIGELRMTGQGYKQIAEALGISVNTVKSYCLRSGLIGFKASDDAQAEEHQDTCRQCGTSLRQRPGVRKKVFCSDECRIRWWSKNRYRSVGTAIVIKRCEHCGSPFRSVVSAKRKFCVHACYVAHRKEKRNDARAV